MSLITNITLTVASTPKSREVMVEGQPKQVLDIFGLVVTGRKRNQDGSYEDVLMPVEVSIWNGAGVSLTRDHQLNTGDRLALQVRIKGHRAYVSKEGEAKSILTLEYQEGSGYPLVQKARRADMPDQVAF